MKRAIVLAVLAATSTGCGGAPTPTERGRPGGYLLGRYRGRAWVPPANQCYAVAPYEVGVVEVDVTRVADDRVRVAWRLAAADPDAGATFGSCAVIVRTADAVLAEAVAEPVSCTVNGVTAPVTRARVATDDGYRLFAEFDIGDNCVSFAVTTP